jgi:hypothetical protein
VRRRDVDLELGDEALKPRDLALRQIEHESRERARVDDRMLERALQATADEPGVEGVVAVLDEHRALREAKKRASRVLEHRRADQHRAVDVVALFRVGIDRGAAVDQRVEEGKRLLEREAFGPELEHEERRVAGRLDVEGDELRLVERSLGPDLRRVDRDLLPRHRSGRAARLEEDRPGAHLAAVKARRAQTISSLVTARRSKRATT